MDFSIELRPALPADEANIVDLLQTLQTSYPGFSLWLKKKLQQVFNNEARSTLAFLNDELVGITIGSIKQGRKFKLSTLYVKEEAQSLHIGSMLLSILLSEVTNLNVDYIYFTTDATLDETVGKFFKEKGFVLVDTLPDKYKKDYTENVYSLTLK